MCSNKVPVYNIFGNIDNKLMFKVIEKVFMNYKNIY